MKAIHLQTEYLTEPLGLGIAAPRFFWNCEGGKTQTAYQIIAKVHGETIWNSGKVASSKMTHIPYQGRALHSRERVYWSVKLWDENGDGGEISSSWFELGLLEQTDWTAKWISGNYKPKKNVRYPVDCFHKIFATEKKIQSARLYASAKGLYDVAINGKRIEDFILAPGMTDYHKRIQYQSYDVTDLLSKENVVQLRLADGWYRGSSAAYGVTNVYGTQTSVIAQLEITFTDSSSQTVCTDETWEWSNDGPIRFADLKDGEVYNAQMVPSFAGKAITVPNDVPLVASNNVPVREMERFTPKLLPENILDFGQNLAGYLEFTVEGKPEQTMILTCGEILDEDGNLDLSNIQEQRPIKGWNQMGLVAKLLTGKTNGESVGTPLQEIRFTCSGGLDHYKTSFAVFGFRYVHVDCDFPIDPKQFAAIAVYSAMEQTGSFTCSNKLVNRLVENTRWSMKGNYLDIPTDCPTRERLGWTGDAQIFFATGAYLMDTAAFFRKWMRDMEDAQYADGVLPAVLPYQGVEMMYKTTGASVGWADAVYLIPYRYFKRFGDKSVLEECWPMMEKYAAFLIDHLGMTDKKAAQANPYDSYTYEKGMHLGEWLEPEEFQEKITAGKQPKHPEEATAYLHLAMRTMAEIADILGKPADKYREIAQGSQKAYTHLFGDTLDTDRQAKLVRPLALGLLDGETKKRAQSRLVKAVTDYNYHVGTGFLSTPFLLPVLTEAGEAEIAYKMLENTEKPGWLAEILDGATTIWENWEGNLSQNHYSPGAVCQWLFETAAGIRPDGERHFVIAPIPGVSLTYASGSYRSPYGTVESRWERSGGKTDFTIIIPANTGASICLPGQKSLEVGAGTYCFAI